MTRTDRRTLVRQLAGQGLSQRQIAARLQVSKDTVRRDLRQAAQQGAAGQGPDAPPDAPHGEPGDAPPSSPDAPPGATADTVAHDGGRLVLDPDRFPGMAADLGVLARTGLGPGELVARAVGAVADAYRTALREGRIEPGVPFFLPPIELRPAPWLQRTAAPSPR